jgi:hypothetical protein
LYGVVTVILTVLTYLGGAAFVVAFILVMDGLLPNSWFRLFGRLDNLHSELKAKKLVREARRELANRERPEGQ